jgi:hypothetical protein
MRANEVLYDSETLLRLVDSEIEELRAEPLSNEAVAISPQTPESLPSDSEQRTSVGAALRGPSRCP